MKRSFYPKLAWGAIRKNKRMYVPYILTGSIMIMMFYILSSLIESPTLADIHGGSFLMDLLPLGCSVIAIFSLIFLFYTNSFLIRQRYREFGLYNILGMDKHNISRLMIWETFYTGAIALGIGIAFGLAFSKAAELILLNILDLEISFALHIGRTSIWQTAVLYILIYIVLLINALIKIRRSKPLELMQSSRVGEKKLKCNWLFALIGVVLLVWAYYLSVSIQEPATALLLFFVAVIMVIVGTYLVFISGSVVFCKILQKNKKYYYKPNHFISVSSMAYRMKRNGAGLASICILLTMVLVMLSSTTTLYFGEEESIKNRYPNDINITMYFDAVDDIDDENLNTLRNQITPYAPKNTDLTGTRYALAAGEFTDTGLILDYTHVETIDYDNVGYLYVISIEDYNNMMHETKTLAEDECFIYTNRLKTTWNTFTMEYGTPYKVKEQLTEFREDGTAMAMTLPSAYIVVNDIYTFVEPVLDLKNSNGDSMMQYEWLVGFDCETSEEEAVAYSNIVDIFPNITSEDASFQTVYIESREAQRFSFYEMYGSLFFLGIMLSIVFLIAAVLIIYYKQISEGYEDQNRFEIMQKIGMTDHDIRKSINSQMLTVFFLPLVMAGIHLAFAFPFIAKILVMFAFTNTMLNICVTVICFLIFGLFYTIVYKITSNSYYAIVSGRNNA